MKKRLLIALILAIIIVAGLGTATALASTTTISKYTGSTYTHSSTFDGNTIILDGIDVSYVQKNNIDWEQAKADGIDFAIIRVGARGYGSAGTLITDDYYKENIEAAQAAGIMVGVYFFSQATTELEATMEAKYTLNLIEGYDLDLPIFMDYEYAGGSSGRLTTAQLSKVTMTAIAEKFCSTIEDAGYEVGIYANLSFLNSSINGKSLSNKYTIWVAQYNTSCSYSYAYTYWQYTSSGSVIGYSSRLDTDFMYLSTEVTASDEETSIADASVAFSGTSTYTYSPGTVYTPSVSVIYNGVVLKEGTDYKKYYLKNGQAGTAYVLIKGIGEYTDYQLVPFTINPSSDLSGITAARIKNKYYTGSARVPSTITMTDSLGYTLIKNLDYTFTVTDATEIGTATVTVTFIGNYTGTKTLTYDIIKGNQTITADTTTYEKVLSDGSFTLSGVTASDNGKLSYASSDTDVVTVNSSGKVTIVGTGTATITVTAAETDNYKSATLDITVNVSESAQTITTGADTYTKTQLAKAFSLNAESNVGNTLTYASSNTSVATVDSNGMVTLMGAGTAKITITAPAFSGCSKVTKTVTIKVTALDEDTYATKYAKLVSGVEKTKVVLLKATATSSKVTLTWKKSSSGYAVDYYQVWKSTQKSSGYKKILTTVSASKKSCINTSNVSPSTTYWYKVRGVRNVEGTLIYTPFTKISVTTLAE